MTNQRVPVPPPVLAGLEALRASRRCNMFELPCVFQWLTAHDYIETVQWLRNHHEDYSNGIVYGFEAMPS